MIRPEDIPNEVVEAAIEAMSDCGSDVIGSRMARASILAALNAWPGNIHYRGGWEPVINNHQRKPQLILPLPQEDVQNAER